MRTSRRFLIGAIPWIIVVGALGAAEREETEPIEGTWHASSASREGVPANDLLGHRLTLDDDRFEIQSSEGEVLYRGTFRIDPDPSPPTIDFSHEFGPTSGTTWLGIYRLDQQTLRICDNAPAPDRPRPTRFISERNSGTVLITFERASP